LSDPNISLIKKVIAATTQGRGLRGYSVIIELAESGMIRWKQSYAGAPWNDIIDIADLKGDKGDNSHIHIKWHAEGSETLLDTPDAYIGIYADNEIADSEMSADYSWYLYKGEKGNPAPNTIFQYSVNNIDWTTTATGAQWYRQSGDNGATWSEAIAIPTTAYADAKVAETITNGVTGIAPSQNAVFDALALKAPLASPTFTGDVIVPDQTAGNNSTKAANTKYADAKVADAINDGVTGIAPSQNAVFDALALKANAGYVTASLALKADLTYVEYLMMEGDPA
jgi:hypothetical protein